MRFTVRSLSRPLAFIALLLVMLSASCSLYRNDRMWIPQAKYDEALKVYQRTSSIDLTEQILRESHNWQRGEINEALYRIKQQYRMDQP